MVSLRQHNWDIPHGMYILIPSTWKYRECFATKSNPPSLSIGISSWKKKCTWLGAGWTLLLKAWSQGKWGRASRNLDCSDKSSGSCSKPDPGWGEDSPGHQQVWGCHRGCCIFYIRTRPLLQVLGHQWLFRAPACFCGVWFPGLPPLQLLFLITCTDKI